MRGPRTLVLAGLALGLVAARCLGGDGSGAAARTDSSAGANCAALASQFPPGFDFVANDPQRVIVADFAPPTLVGFDITGERPLRTLADPVYVIPPDSDGDGVPEGSGALPFSVVLDDLFANDPLLASLDLALATSSGYEELLFLAGDGGAARQLEVSVDARFAPADNLFLPAPGSSALRTGLSTLACVRPLPGAEDSRGTPLTSVLSQAASCDPTVLAYYATFTSGVAVANSHLFVSMSNLGGSAGTANPQYLPGSVLIYDIDTTVAPARISPNPTRPFLFTTGFNPTHVTAYSVAGREFVLVSVSGSLGIVADDPSTPEIESGGLALTPASVDVIDAQSLELVATVPLGLSALAFGLLSIDGAGRVAVAGSAIASELLAIDLAPLLSLPSLATPPLVLDGSSGPNAVIFDAQNPFSIPRLPNGAPPLTCPGQVVSTSFDDDGTLLYATEFCDGTLSIIAVDTAGAPPVPLPMDRFSFVQSLEVVAPLRPDTLGLLRGPGAVRVRPGVPGVDYAGPDVFFLAAQPEGTLCAVRIESS